MKTIILLLSLMVFFVISCRSNHSDKTEVTAKTPNGGWVNTNYATALVNTCSPIEAQRTAYYTFLTIVNDTMQLIINLHEGFALPLVENTPDNYTAVAEWDATEKYQLVCTPDTVTLLHEKEEVRFIRGPLANDADELSRYINSNTIAGKYRSVKSKKAIVFAEDGTVKGISPYTTYSIWYDFAGTPVPFDLIQLQSLDGKVSYKHWKKKDGILQLFTTFSPPEIGEPTEIRDEFIRLKEE